MPPSARWRSPREAASLVRLVQCGLAVTGNVPGRTTRLAALFVYASHPNAQTKGCFPLLVPVFARKQSPHHALLHWS
jgi:hypothetical protein